MASVPAARERRLTRDVRPHGRGMCGVKLDKQMDLKFWFVDGTRGDKLGDVVKKQQAFTYDYGGGGGTENTWYYYNKEGKLEYVDYDTPASGQDMKLAYDGLGRRIMVQRGTATVSGGQVTSFSAAETKKYVYLGGSVIRELDASNNVLKEYVRGLDLGGGIGGIIYQKKSSDYYYYHYNHKGDVVALTDGNGKLAASYEYDAWGNTMTQAQKTVVDNPYRYSTKEWEGKSGLYYFGFRYYRPETGRWTQRDPVRDAESLNLCAYVRNEPVGNVHPLGSQSCPCGEALTQGFAVGPFYAYRGFRLSREALRTATAMRFGDRWKTDAFRHCYWSCRMTQEMTAHIAKTIGTIHEDCTPNNPAGERAMDEFNNAVGRRLGSKRGTNCKSACSRALRDGELQLSPGGEPGPEAHYPYEEPEWPPDTRIEDMIQGR